MVQNAKTLIYFSLVLGVSCNKTTQSEHAFFDVAAYYDGTARTAGKAIAQIKDAPYSADNLNIAVQICADHPGDRDMVSVCQKTLSALEGRAPTSDARVFFKARAALQLHNVLMSQQTPLCQGEILELSKETNLTDFGSIVHFSSGLAAFCSTGNFPNGTLLHKDLLSDLERQPTETNRILRQSAEAFSFWKDNPAHARVYYRGARLSEAYKFAEIHALLENTPASEASTLVRAELRLAENLVAPRTLAEKSVGIRRSLAEIADKYKLCNTDSCHFLSARASRLIGDLQFQKREFADAVKSFDRCRKIFSSGECLERASVARLAAGQKIPEDDQVMLKNRTGHGFVSNFLGHTAVESGAVELKDRFKQNVTRLPNHGMQKVLNDLLRKIVTHPYLRGRVPFNIQVEVVASKDAVAHFAGGAGYIFIGDKFLEQIKPALAGGEYRIEDILAMTLGHEVHHLVAGHGVDTCNVLHHENRFALGQGGTSNALVKAASQHESWRREYEADEQGMLYAFLTGKKAGAFLATLYLVGRDGKAGGSDTHPATVERIRVLREKMQVLSVAALAFNRSNETIANIDKLARAGKEVSDALLKSAEKDLTTFSEIVPGYPAAYVNFSYVALRRILNKVGYPEMPVSAMMNIDQVLKPPSSVEHAFDGAGGVKIPEDICSVKKWRPSMANNPYVHMKPQILSAQVALTKAVERFPEDYRLHNNLAVTWLLRAQTEIQSAMAKGCVQFSTARQREILGYLKHAFDHLQKAQAGTEANQQDILQNKAAALISRYHVTRNLADLQQAQRLFVTGTDKGIEKIQLNQGIRMNDLVEFTVAYAAMLQLFHDIYGEGADITGNWKNAEPKNAKDGEIRYASLCGMPARVNDLKQAQGQAKQLIEALRHGQPITRWQKEVQNFGVIVNDLNFSSTGDFCDRKKSATGGG